MHMLQTKKSDKMMRFLVSNYVDSNKTASICKAIYKASRSAKRTEQLSNLLYMYSLRGADSEAGTLTSTQTLCFTNFDQVCYFPLQ